MLRELRTEDAEAVAALIVGANPRRGIDAEEVRSWRSQRPQSGQRPVRPAAIPPGHGTKRPPEADEVYVVSQAFVDFTDSAGAKRWVSFEHHGHAVSVVRGVTVELLALADDTAGDLIEALLSDLRIAGLGVSRWQFISAPRRIEWPQTWKRDSPHCGEDERAREAGPRSWHAVGPCRKQHGGRSAAHALALPARGTI